LSAGTDIAAEIAAALAEAGAATGDGGVTCALEVITGLSVDPRVPDASSTTYQPLTGVLSTKQVRDQTGMLTGRTEEILTVNATGAVPAKGQRIAIGVLPGDADDASPWRRIMKVDTLAPGNVPLLYELTLED